MSDQDITQLVLSEHEAFRRDFAKLRELPGEELERAWAALADALEVHAAAEEAHFYPYVVREVTGGEQETEAALHDHNEIRAAARAVADYEAGGEQWWAAVEAAQEVNGAHMAEEESDILPGMKQSLSSERRDELGLLFLRFHDEHEGAEGLSGEPQDVPAYVEEHAAG